MAGLNWNHDPDWNTISASLNNSANMERDFESRMMDAIEDVWQAFGGMLSDNACCEIAELVAEGKIKGISTTFDRNTPLADYPEGADAAWVADMLGYHNKRKEFADELDRIEQSKVYGLPIETINGWYKYQDDEKDAEQDNSIASILEGLGH